MGICRSSEKRKERVNYVRECTMPLAIAQIHPILEQMNKSICKINNENSISTGFLCLIPNRKLNYDIKALITCNHALNDLKLGNKLMLIFINKEKEIIIDEFTKIYTNNENRITIIELKENEFNLDDYLKIDDLIYKENELKELYNDKHIYIIHYPKGIEVKYSVGEIKNIDNSKIEYCCAADEGSSGAPILNLNNYKVIGIHIGKIKNLNYNVGEIIKFPINDFYFNKGKNLESNIKINEFEFNKNENNKINTLEEKSSNNYIIAEIEIKEEDINKDIRIINSYEQYKREYYWEDNKKDYENEKEIKENCEIKINNKIIPFSYFYNFTKKEKYIIQYSFKNKLSKINYMFSECSSLTNINLSNFNTQNVIDMNNMFNRCSSLTNVNLSNFNTENVNNMSHTFCGCSSLTKINLSNFDTKNVTNMSNLFSKCKALITINLSNLNTKNVTDMSYMFSECNSLTNINLSNFNTQNVKNMNCMFWECNSLTNINLSNFNTQNVTNMSWMFYKCISLTNINLSNFNTQNVTDMSYMFSGCSSLSNINLSNFNTQKVTNMSCMFYECRSLEKLDLSNFKTRNDTNIRCMFYFCDFLKKENVKSKDKNIINELNNLKLKKN